MKIKYILLNLLFAFSLSTSAQTLFEGFEEEGVVPPTNWSIKQSEELTSSHIDIAEGETTWHQNFHENNHYSGTFGFRITSKDVNYNWLITPTVIPSEEEDLSFMVKFRNRDVFNCDLYVMVKEKEATTWTQLEKFTDVGDGENPESFVKKIIELSDYSNTEIQIALVHNQVEIENSDDGTSKIAIDDFTIGVITNTEDAILFEGFEEEGVVPPTDWSIKQSDEIDSSHKDIAEGVSTWHQNYHANNHYSGTYGFRITSKDVKYNWLISPMVNLEGNTKVSFMGKFRNIDVFNCDLYLMVKEKDATAWTQLNKYSDVIDGQDPEMFVKKTVELSAYADKEVQFALVHNQLEVEDSESGTSKIAIDDFIVEPSTTTAISETENNAVLVQVYPNPTQGIFNITFLSNTVDASVTLYTLTGSAVFSKILLERNNLMNVSNLPKGVYVLQFKDRCNTSKKKIVIK